MSTPHKGPFSIRVVSWYGPTGPLQLNIVCHACNGMMGIQNIYQIQDFLKWDCPSFILDIPTGDVNGNLDIEALFAAFEKRASSL